MRWTSRRYFFTTFRRPGELKGRVNPKEPEETEKNLREEPEEVQMNPNESGRKRTMGNLREAKQTNPEDPTRKDHIQIKID